MDRKMDKCTDMWPSKYSKTLMVESPCWVYDVHCEILLTAVYSKFSIIKCWGGDYEPEIIASYNQSNPIAHLSKCKQ